MLVIARDTAHAAALNRLLTAEPFDGRYAGTVIQVDSGTTSGTEGDEIVQRLLAVERYTTGEAATILNTSAQSNVAAVAKDVINGMSRTGASPDGTGGSAPPMATGAALTSADTQAESIRQVKSSALP